MSQSPIVRKVWTSEVADLIYRIKKIDSGDQISASCYVFKVNEELRKNLSTNQEARDQIVFRYPGKHVYLLGYDNASGKHNIHWVRQGSLDFIDDKNLLGAIREADLLEVISQTSGDCILDAPDGSHFITPSEKHTTQFLRLADALHSYNALDRLSYWLQAEIRGVAGIVIDTWSLASIVLGSQLLLDSEGRMPFDCFNRHIMSDEDDAERVLSKLAAKMVGDGPLLCLVSVSSSGSFFHAFENVVKKLNIQNEVRVLSIYKFADAPDNIEALAKLDISLKWYDESNCEYCSGEERVTAYEIDPKYYYPREHKENIIRIHAGLLRSKAGGKSKASQFIHQYGKTPGVLRVHRDDPNDGSNPRHHAFYIDVATLLEQKLFLNEFTAAINDLKDVINGRIVIVTPPHRAGITLGKIASELLGAELISHENLKGVNREEEALIYSAEHLIILDDVLISGTRITRYLTSLRQVFDGQKLGVNLKKVTWFPMIARPSDRRTIERIKDGLAEHTGWVNELRYLYEMVLPEWDKENGCPWCKEKAILEKIVEPAFIEPEWYRARRDALVYGENAGLTEDPLFLLPGIARATAGSGSPMSDEGLSEMQVIFLFATAIQCLRNDRQKPLGHGLFQSHLLTMFGAENVKASAFLRFQEPMFQAVILRTVKCDEWSRDVKTNGVTEIAKLFSGGTSDILLGEYILFLHRIGYNKILPVGCGNALSRWDDEIVRLLIERFR